MNRRAALMLGLALARPVAGSEETDAARRSLEASVPRLMQLAQVPGVAVAIVRGADVETWTHGTADARSGAPVDGGTVFEAASISKPVFAWAVLRLVEEGRLDLDRPLASYLAAPWISDPRAAVVTARMVLTHRTGFPNWRPRGKDLAVVFEPGTRFSYSGEGFIFLQRAVEAITGEDLEPFMRRVVFEPLGMKRSSYVWLPSYDTAKAWGHDDTGHVTARRKPDGPNAAATLHTTAGDLGRFLSAVLERRGLRAETYRLMLEPEVSPPRSCAMCASEKDPGPPSATVSWGLGWAFLELRGRRYLWHWGDNGAFKALVLADEAAKRGAVVLADGAGGLAIAGDVASIALDPASTGPGPGQIPLDWLQYDHWDSPVKTALHGVVAGGGVAALEPLRSADGPSRQALNSLGSSLLAGGFLHEALAAFRLNTERHPESWNVWDSLGEGLSRAGRCGEAVSAYRKSVELNPGNETGVLALSELERR